MKNIRTFTGKVVFSAFSLILANTAFAAPVSCASNQIAGFAFRDFNSNGTVDAFETGVEGLSVSVTAPDGSTVTTQTDSTGYFAVSTSSAAKHRVTLSGLPAELRFGFATGSDADDVRFITPGKCDVEFALSAPAEFCAAPGSTAKLATTRFINGDPLAGGNAGSFGTVVSFDSNAQGLGMPINEIASSGQTGSVWGLAYSRATKAFYTSAFMKRHTGFGPLGASGIYKVVETTPGSSVVTPFVRLEDFGFSAGNDSRVAGDLPADVTLPSVDEAAWPLVGKISFGDLEMSEDESRLFVSNLFDKAVYEIKIPTDGSNPTAADIARYPVSNPGCSNGDFVIGALKNYRSNLYLGVVCTAETSQLRSDLKAIILKKTATGDWSNFFEFPLFNFDRGFSVATNYPSPGNPVIPSFPDNGGKWQPWKSTFADLLNGTLPAPITFYSYPQAMLSNIDFTEQGELVMAFQDRSAQQYGRFNLAPGSVPSLGVNAFEYCASAGDLMLACPDAETGALTLENNGRCGIRQAASGEGNGQGPGGGEMFPDDFSYFPGYGVEAHRETYLGAAAYRAGSNEIIAMGFNIDKFHQENAGYAAVTFETNKHSRFGEVYSWESQAFFGKAAGLGDVEYVCDPAPIQLGNRVWIDTNNNGIQDADELGVAGVTVQLIDSNGNVLATHVTDANGNYYFGSTDGVVPMTNYTIRLGNAADFATGGPLAGFGLTSENVGSDSLDSDGVPFNGLPQISVTTGKAGENNHTLDFGFNALTCVESNLTSVSATIDGSAKALLSISNKAARSVKNAKAKGCRAGISKTTINGLSVTQNDLHMDIWTAAWQLPATTFNCPVVPNSCSSVNISEYKTNILGDVTQLYNGVTKLLNNKCIKNRKATKSLRKAAKKEFNSSKDAVAGLSNTLVSCN